MHWNLSVHVTIHFNRSVVMTKDGRHGLIQKLQKMLIFQMDI